MFRPRDVISDLENRVPARVRLLHHLLIGEPHQSLIQSHSRERPNIT